VVRKGCLQETSGSLCSVAPLWVYMSAPESSAKQALLKLLEDPSIWEGACENRRACTPGHQCWCILDQGHDGEHIY